MDKNLFFFPFPQAESFIALNDTITRLKDYRET